MSFIGSKNHNTKKKHHNNSKTNCSPTVDGKTVTNDTCFTSDILVQIKSDYNHVNKTNPIVASDPKKILKELRTRLTSCSKEDCWLSQIKDNKLKEKIQKYIFAPKHPSEWNYNPNEWLSNYDIFNVLVQYENRYPHFEFIGPSFIDFDSKNTTNNDKCVSNELCNFSLKNHMSKKHTNIAIVFNLDKHTQSGSHWVSLFIDIPNQIIFYFDSAGNKIPNEIMALVNRIKKQGKELKNTNKTRKQSYKNNAMNFKFYENWPLEHQYGNTECGMYSLFFIITMLTGKNDDRTFKTSREKINFFRKTRIPDKYVENLRWKYFND
jgi:hypothetical protein